MAGRGCSYNMAVGVTTDVVKGLLKGHGSLKAFFVGLHNAFVHGEILEEMDYEDYDENTVDELLGGLFEHFEGLVALAKD